MQIWREGNAHNSHPATREECSGGDCAGACCSQNAAADPGCVHLRTRSCICTIFVAHRARHKNPRRVHTNARSTHPSRKLLHLLYTSLCFKLILFAPGTSHENSIYNQSLHTSRPKITHNQIAIPHYLPGLLLLAFRARFLGFFEGESAGARFATYSARDAQDRHHSRSSDTCRRPNVQSHRDK